MVVKCCVTCSFVRSLSATFGKYSFVIFPFSVVSHSLCPVVGTTTLPTSCADCLEILEASTSWNPKGLSRPVEGLPYIFHLWHTFNWKPMQNNLELTVTASRSNRNSKSGKKGAALMCHTWTAGHQNITPSVRNRKLHLDMNVHSLCVQFRENWCRKWHADGRQVYTARLRTLEFQPENGATFLETHAP
jgi:hypothetical protein